jgi:hypothetical protein
MEARGSLVVEARKKEEEEKKKKEKKRKKKAHHKYHCMAFTLNYKTTTYVFVYRGL